MWMPAFLKAPSLQDDFDTVTGADAWTWKVGRATKRLLRNAVRSESALPSQEDDNPFLAEQHGSVVPLATTAALLQAKKLLAPLLNFSKAARSADKSITAVILSQSDALRAAWPVAANDAVASLVTFNTLPEQAEAGQNAAMKRWEESLSALPNPQLALDLARRKTKATHYRSVYRPRMAKLMLDLARRVGQTDALEGLRGIRDAYNLSPEHLHAQTVRPILQAAAEVVDRAGAVAPGETSGIADYLAAAAPFRATDELKAAARTLEEAAARFELASRQPQAGLARRAAPDSNTL